MLSGTYYAQNYAGIIGGSLKDAIYVPQRFLLDGNIVVKFTNGPRSVWAA